MVGIKERSLTYLQGFFLTGDFDLTEQPDPGEIDTDHMC